MPSNRAIGARSRFAQRGVISVFVQIVAVALWRRVQHANTPSALQNRDDSHENRGHPGLPDGDGVDLIRELRTWSDAPVLVLSARTSEEDKVEALDAGADDYLMKPFGASELLARVRAHLRRRGGAMRGAAAAIEFGDVKIVSGWGRHVDRLYAL